MEPKDIHQESDISKICEQVSKITTSNTLEGNVALVTGGTRGIGRRIIEHLASQGATIVFSGSKATEKTKEIEKELQDKYSVKCEFIPANLKDNKQIEELVEATLKKYEKIDILINNAGYALIEKLVDTSLVQLEEVMQINFTAPYLLCKLVVPHMQKNKYGRIINISSVTTVRAEPNLSAYIAAKSAINGFTKSLAREVGESGITCNIVYPGTTETEMLSEGAVYMAKQMGIPTETFLASFVEKSATKKLTQPDDVARIVLFLVSKESHAITGASYIVDGGHTI
jgi:NAD(P)-dependent dehydrogenase (short-subunit alcohol dehydrogenase family)